MNDIKLIAPDSQHHRSVLGAGSSKFAWKSDYLKGVVINSLDWQRRDQKPEGIPMYQWNVEYDDKMRTEYQFTKYLRKIFGYLIPWVKSIPSHRFDDIKFRYEKELCGEVDTYSPKERLKFFHEMFAIEDMVLSKGWVFLDMKPDNVGIHKDTYRGTLCLIDTDPCHFYRVPPVMIEHFRVASYIIIFLISLRTRIPIDILVEKMKEKGITTEKMENTYQYFQKLEPVDMKNIEYYGNKFLRDEPFEIKGLLNPRLFIHGYGYDIWTTLLSIAPSMKPTLQTTSVSLNSPEHSVNLNHSISNSSIGKVSQNASKYSMNSLLNTLNTSSPIYYPRGHRKRLTKRRTTRILARNMVRKANVNIIRDRVSERKKKKESEHIRRLKKPTPARRKTAKGIKI